MHNKIPRKILRQSAEDTTNSFPKIYYTITPDITPILKKKDLLEKMNYRLVSVLPPVSKIFERLMQKQINTKNKLSPYWCGYRKGFSKQYALLSLIERWKKFFDEKGFGGAILMDFSKTFDTLSH